jgi:hypothetical protein
MAITTTATSTDETITTIIAFITNYVTSTQTKTKATSTTTMSTTTTATKQQQQKQKQHQRRCPHLHSEWESEKNWSHQFWKQRADSYFRLVTLINCFWGEWGTTSLKDFLPFLTRTHRQGDQIGRIFANSVIVFLMKQVAHTSGRCFFHC